MRIGETPAGREGAVSFVRLDGDSFAVWLGRMPFFEAFFAVLTGFAGVGVDLDCKDAVTSSGGVA